MKTIYLDLDGVLVDFHARVCRELRAPVPKRYEDMEEHMHWVRRQPAAWWAMLDPYDLDLWRECASLCNVVVASEPCSSASAAGKTAWCNQWLPNTDVILLREKWQLARPTALLIDDSQAQVHTFMMAGGAALLYPRPWNTKGDIKLSPLFKNIEDWVEGRFDG